MAEQKFISQWIDAAKAGEQPAWENLFKHFYPSIYATALNLCKSIPIAQDMVQETFLTAFLKLSQLNDNDAFGVWLKKILIRHCYRSFKKEYPSRHEAMTEDVEGWWENEWHQKFEHLSNQSQIQSNLASVSEKLRSVLLLRYFSGYSSYEDIAALLAIPIGTVRSRLSEARAKLSANWSRTADSDSRPWQQSEEWNQFYLRSFEGMHRKDDCKDRFLHHLEKNVVLITPDGQKHMGRTAFESIIQDDRRAGSWLTPTNVATAENISIIEVSHFNSPENPSHCPQRSAMILFRKGIVASQVGIHMSWQ